MKREIDLTVELGTTNAIYVLYHSLDFGMEPVIQTATPSFSTIIRMMNRALDSEKEEVQARLDNVLVLKVVEEQVVDLFEWDSSQNVFVSYENWQNESYFGYMADELI